ncbi:jouberin isoform X2 [Xenopus tropicalis]|uniref:Jouberin n=1 Tax=Xenopus tropicalis TaxID=8364 RepID=A0A8J0QLG6_XENTR|nr:jouberin isoform X2 [Xenopus tropicalis]
MPAIESEAKLRTKARFEEVFQSYAGLPGTKNKSRKKTTPEEHIVLESFKGQLDLLKNSANETIINTYNAEEESPRFTKNRLRERTPVAEKQSNVNKEQTVVKLEKKKNKKTKLSEAVTIRETFDESLDLAQQVSNSEEQKCKTRKKKEKDVWKEERGPSDFNDEDHLIEENLVHVSQKETEELREKIKNKLKTRLYQQPVINDTQTVPMNNEIGIKKKKKKEMVVTSEPETSVTFISELQHGPPQITSLQPQLHFSEHFVNESLPTTKVKKIKKKAKAIKEDGPENGIEDDNKEKHPKHLYDPSLVLGVYIHRSDKLLTRIMVSRPIVKIHVIDQRTGAYVKKESSINAVSSLKESESNAYILPVETQAYDFKRHKSPIPEWDEQIIINERFLYFLQENEDSPNVILFFEIIDICNSDGTNPNSESQIKEKGFRRLAWAFLKLVGANEVFNVDTKLRLQLYYPPSRARLSSNCHIYEWWLKYPRNPYPSTLYVTVKGLKLKADPTSDTFGALQQDLGSSILDNDLQNEADGFGEGKPKKELYKWSRLPGQACRIPNKRILSLRAGHMGCFSICFSNDGKTLAAACADRDGYPIYLYEIPSGECLGELHGHLNVVYDLCWSRNDQHLLTASSDATVRLWKIENEASSALKVLPHPSFVYTAKFHPKANSFVVTGCYDAVIRVWNVNVKESNGQLLQEFDGHNSFINTLCFDIEGLQMYSGDSSGLIIIWDTHISEKSRLNPVQNWSIFKIIKEDYMKGIPVNHLQLHPNGRRLLIHSKDSTLRIMDLRILAAKKYIGATNYREKLRSAFTPCGTFVFAGSEDRIAYVWNAETGDQVAKYSELSYTAPLRDVAFHPHEHMVAFCAFGQNQPVLVYIYDYKVAQLEAEAVQISSNMILENSEILGLQESPILSADRFASAARISMRMLQVKQKLDSVLQPHSNIMVSGVQSTQLMTQKSASSFGGFSPVGQALSRTPSIKLQMSNTEARISSLKIEADNALPFQETVVALYDYTAHRSDELTIHRSDIIHVLYKDNDNWWFGSLANGQQGYFPANYVASENEHNDSFSPAVAHDLDDRNMEQYDIDQSYSSNMMSAVSSTSKDLKFMPQTDTDADSPVTHGSRHDKQLYPEPSNRSTKMTSLHAEPSDIANTALPEWGQISEKVAVKPKKKKILKNSSTAGQTNNAFEPDSQDNVGYPLYKGLGKTKNHLPV